MIKIKQQERHMANGQMKPDDEMPMPQKVMSPKEMVDMMTKKMPKKMPK